VHSYLKKSAARSFLPELEKEIRLSRGEEELLRQKRRALAKEKRGRQSKKEENRRLCSGDER